MILLCVIILSAIFVFLKFRRKSICDIPGPRPVPIVGNAFEFLAKDAEPLAVMWRLQNEHPGGIFRFWLGSDLYLTMTDPVDIEVILSSYKHILKSISYKYIVSWLGNGLITSYGDIWHRHRKFLTPTFHFKILENSLDIIYENTKILADQLRIEEGKSEFDVHSYIEKCSLDIICEVAMDVKINAQTTDNSSYLHAIKSVTNISTSRIFKLWLQPDILFRLFGNYKLYQRSLQIIETVSEKVISSKRKKIEESDDNSSSVQTDIEIKKKALIPFLDCLLKESNFCNKEIHDEVLSFLFAGHDTTTSSICFCIYQLANYPAVQEKVYDEIMEILPTDGCPTIHDLNNLKYTENVIKETLRLYPAVPMIGRTLTEEVKLPSGYTLPANSHLNIFIFAMHRNPEVFPEPENFLPERFDKNENNRHPFCYIPFSAGPRNCIGQKLAMLEVKLVLSTLLRNFKLLPADKTKSITLKAEIILRTKEGIPVRLIKRV